MRRKKSIKKAKTKRIGRGSFTTRSHTLHVCANTANIAYDALVCVCVWKRYKVEEKKIGRRWRKRGRRRRRNWLCTFSDFCVSVNERANTLFNWCMCAMTCDLLATLHTLRSPIACPLQRKHSPTRTRTLYAGARRLMRFFIIFALFISNQWNILTIYFDLSQKQCLYSAIWLNLVGVSGKWGVYEKYIK